MSQFHAEAPHAAVSERLAQGLYVAARAGFEPTTLHTKGGESTNEWRSFLRPRLWTVEKVVLHRVEQLRFFESDQRPKINSQTRLHTESE